MAEEGGDADKTEEPSDRRLQKAREDGMIAHSREVGPALNFIIMVSLVYFAGEILYFRLADHFRVIFSNLRPWENSVMPFMSLVWPSLNAIMALIAGFLIVSFIGPVLGHVVQKGWDPKYEAAKPKLDKLNPLEGAKNLFSIESLVSFAKNLVKMAGFIYIFYLTTAPYLDRILYIAAIPFFDALALTGEVLTKFVTYAMLFLAVLAALDYYVNWRRTHSKLMMSRQEIKDEMKESEGNPQIKGKVRQIQMERTKRMISKEVPGATVVVTNPTHFAIALKYKKGSVPVPRVVAKGADLLAKRIREVAMAHGIPIVENPPLARALYKEVKNGREIPYKFYKAVAKVIATILRLEEEKKAHRYGLLHRGQNDHRPMA